MRIPGERALAGIVEVVLLGALLVFLGIAAWKLFWMLDRTGISRMKGLPFAALFAGAAYLTGRRMVRVYRLLKSGEDDGISARDDR